MNFDALIVGLGNPGPRYAFTRHNAGFLLLDVLAQDAGVRFDEKSTLSKKTGSHTATIELGGKKCLLMKPQTFMNLSGQSVRALYDQAHHLRDKPLVVAHDEADLPAGKVRVKMGGSDAGNNGLKSLRDELGTGEFFRVRLGVGKPGPDSKIELHDHVLQEFTKEEAAGLIQAFDLTVQAIQALLEGELLAAQSLVSKIQ